MPYHAAFYRSAVVMLRVSRCDAKLWAKTAAVLSVPMIVVLAVLCVKALQTQGCVGQLESGTP